MKYIILNIEGTPSIMPDLYDDSLNIFEDFEVANYQLLNYKDLGFEHVMIVPLDTRLMKLVEEAAEFIDVTLYELGEFDKLEENEEKDTLADNLYQLLGY